MKTKNKTLALVEIAIVLCSVFLVALPAIAADQVPQKSSASTIIATADRPTYEHTDLDVFGNANEDDTIDMRDTMYIKLVIFGKKRETDLADANYDGKVSMLDVGQTKLIILGKEKELTFIDIFGEAETVNKPIKRMAGIGWYVPFFMRTFGARDIIVAVGGSHYKEDPTFYPELSKLPDVGRGLEADFEAVLNLKPDAVMPSFYTRPLDPEKKKGFKDKLPGIPLICLDLCTPTIIYRNIRTLGYIIDKEDKVEEFIDWYTGYLELCKARTEGLSEDKKPRVVMFGYPLSSGYKCAPTGSRIGWTIPTAGGRNIVDEIAGPDSPQYTKWGIEVDPEWVIEQNPEIIIGGMWGPLVGYDSDDPSGMVARRQESLNKPELVNIDAVKNKRVYIVDIKLLSYYGHNILGPVYMGKMFHPDLFIDIDPQAIHQEYVDKFCYIEFDVREHGVFVYPPVEEWKP